MRLIPYALGSQNFADLVLSPNRSDRFRHHLVCSTPVTAPLP
jgi:hypothetical protein